MELLKTADCTMNGFIKQKKKKKCLNIQFNV